MLQTFLIDKQKWCKVSSIPGGMMEDSTQRGMFTIIQDVQPYWYSKPIKIQLLIIRCQKKNKKFYWLDTRFTGNRWGVSLLSHIYNSSWPPNLLVLIIIVKQIYNGEQKSIKCAFFTRGAPLGAPRSIAITGETGTIKQIFAVYPSYLWSSA